MSQLQFEPVSNDETADAFGVLQAVARWLEQQGRRQRIANTRYETYLQWQAQSGNYRVTRAGKTVGIFSLVYEPLLDWTDVEVDEPVYWLRALCTHPDYRGLNVGGFAIEASLSLVDSNAPLYLDCVSGFLPSYYEKHGFESVATQEKDGYQITLLRHQNE